MYAMLVGRLPFRSPRQGTKRRQKLLEQISAGIGGTHEKEMVYISKGAKDLIYRLLQTDSQHRIKLDEVMRHPWITKEGEQPLHAFKCPPPDISTQTMVCVIILFLFCTGPLLTSCQPGRCGIPPDCVLEHLLLHLTEHLSL